MKKLLLILLCLPQFLFTQTPCIPNTIYQDSTYSIWPDTIQNLPYGIVNSNYLTTLQIKTPSTLIEAASGDSSLTTIDTLGTSYYIGTWPVDSIQIVSVLGLPSGFTWSCSANNCTYNGNIVGCIDIFGNTTQSGTYPLTINVNTYTHGSITVFGIPVAVQIDLYSALGAYETIDGYKIIILNSTYGCTDTLACNYDSIATINDSSCVYLTATINTQGVSCYGDSNGAITVSIVGGTTPPYSYFWSNGNNGPINTNLTAGTYYVTITDGVGCINTLSATITEPTAITANLVYNNISINGANNGAISVNAFGGVPGYTYTWTGSNGYINTGANINNLTMGVYTVTIYDANFCSQSFSQAITQPNCNVNINSTYIAPDCPGQMGSLSWLNSGGLPPYTNTLTNSSGTIIPGVNGAQFNSPSTPILLPAGVWDLVVVDAAGCPAILNIPVIVPDSITVILSTTDATCFGYNNGTASATVSGGTAPYTIDWGLVSPNSLIPGNYNVLITDANGCISGPTNYTIGQPAQLVIDSLVTTDVSCTPGNDGTATIYASGGTLPYSYLWNPNGQTTQTAQNLAAGTYSVTILDANVCPLTVSLIQIVNAAPLNVNINVTPISCNGGSDGSLTANFISGVLPLSYSWFDLSNPSVVISSDSTINNLSAGAYSLLVIDANGCIDQGNISLTNPAPLLLQQFFTICDGDSVVVGSIVYNTTGVYTDTLSSVSGCDTIVYTNIVVDQNTSSYDTLSINASIVWNGITLTLSGDYSVTLTNSVGCDSIVNLNLTITNPSGILNITNTEKTLFKITDMLGQETSYRKNTPLFYIYDDGTVEKRITIE